MIKIRVSLCWDIIVETFNVEWKNIIYVDKTDVKGIKMVILVIYVDIKEIVGT